MTVNASDGTHAACLQDMGVWGRIYEVPTEALLAGYNFTEAVQLDAKDRFHPKGPQLEAAFEVPIFNKDWTMQRRVEEVGPPAADRHPAPEQRHPQQPPKPNQKSREYQFPEGRQHPKLEEVQESEEPGESGQAQPVAALEEKPGCSRSDSLDTTCF